MDRLFTLLIENIGKDGGGEGGGDFMGAGGIKERTVAWL